MAALSNALDYFFSVVSTIRIANILDILLLWFILYKTFVFVRDTRAMQLVKGLIAIFVLWQLAQLLSFGATSYVIRSVLEFGALALLVVFQPELRSLLERLGRSGKLYKSFISNDSKSADAIFSSTFNEIQSAVQYMSATKTGAIIVLERQTKLGEHMKNGTILDANVSSEMLLSIFYPNSSLHDGAVIIRDNRIYAAACFLPLTQSVDISHELGTRHRAAIGISEISDCICVVVSEETGAISLVVGGVITRHIIGENVAGLLKTYFIDSVAPARSPISRLFRKKGGGDDDKNQKAL